jgi:hypothetical protein
MYFNGYIDDFTFTKGDAEWADRAVVPARTLTIIALSDDDNPVEYRLFDTDLVTQLGIIQGEGNIYMELNEPGSGSLTVSLDHALASSLTSQRFIGVFYRGAFRHGFIIDNIKKTIVKTEEGASRTITVSGRGMLALLEDSVWGESQDGLLDDFDDTFGPTSYGSELCDKLDVSISAAGGAKWHHGTTHMLDWDFTTAVDSDGHAWDPDDEEFDVQYGTTALDFLRTCAGMGIDFNMERLTTGVHRLHAHQTAYHPLGTDKHDTIIFRVGQNITSLVDTTNSLDLKNFLLVLYKDDLNEFYATHVDDAASIAAYRSRGAKFSAETSVITATSAQRKAQAELDDNHDPVHSIAVTVDDNVSPKVFVDYDIGDTISLDDGTTVTPYRIMAMKLTFPDTGYSRVALTLNAVLPDVTAAITRDARKQGWGNRSGLRDT